MQHSQDSPLQIQALLDAIGGEPLAESGFETEQPDVGFTGTELTEED
jgi:hypothetical protein